MTTENKPRHRWVSRLLLAFKLIGIGLFIYLIFTLDHDEMRELFGRIRLEYFGLAVLLNILFLNTFKIFRWFLILRWMGVRYSFKNSYLAYQSAIFLGMMTPGRMGELMRSVYLKIDEETPIYKGISSVLTDRVFDLMGLLTLAGSAMLFTERFGDFRPAGYYFVGAAVLVAILMIVLRFGPEKKFANMSYADKSFPMKTLASLHHQLKCLDCKRLLIIVLVTAISLCVYATEIWLISKALGLELAPVTASGVAASATMVEVIPITVYGLGTREATVISLMQLLQINETTAFSFSLLLFSNFWIFGGIWALFFWLAKPMRAKSVMKQFKKDTAQEGGISDSED